jgi:hypothetical protein
VTRTDIYRSAITRTFARLYGVSPATVDVSWMKEKIVVQFEGKTFVHSILSDAGDDAPKFSCVDEDPVTVFLTYDEHGLLEQAT